MFGGDIMLRVFIAIAGTFLGFSFIHYAAKKKKPFKRALISMLCGVGGLILLDLLSGFTGVYLPITELSLLISTVGGLPGLALLVLLSAF